MILDSSAIVAVVLREPGYKDLLTKIAAAEKIAVGAATAAEAAIVLSAKSGTDGRLLISQILRSFDVELVPFDEAQYFTAVGAYQKFGKGRHKANLNFGDCLSYALARERSETLLYVGSDFSKTDLPAI